MTNVDIKKYLGGILKDYEYDQEQTGNDRSGEMEALKIATSKFSNPWKRLSEGKKPVKKGRFLCVIKPEKNITAPFIFDICSYTPEDGFYTTSNNHIYIIKPNVIAWTQIPYYFHEEKGSLTAGPEIEYKDSVTETTESEDVTIQYDAEKIEPAIINSETAE